MKYSEVRDQMNPGDMIAFGGTGFISNAIKKITSCNVSHVGAILQSNLPTVEGFLINQVIESTSIGGGFSGVQINRISDHIRDYDGEIWWFKLSPAARSNFDEAFFLLWLLRQVGKPYDTPQAIMSALDMVPDSSEDFSKLFCSELVVEGYERAGAIAPVNASEQTPADVCCLPIFSEIIQLKGDKKEVFK